jgi:endo-1,3-1,4-beta-glycanase ExoK
MKTATMLLAALATATGGVTQARAQVQNIPFFLKYPAIDKSMWYISNGWKNGAIQSCEWRSGALSAVDKRLRITLSDKGGKVAPVGCGEVQSTRRYGYGVYEVSMRSAAGSGLNSNFFTYIGPPAGVPEHDEIDFEFLGKNPRTVQLNYWVKGKSMGEKSIKLWFDASQAFHTYKFVWEPTRITWFIDGRMLHQTPRGAAIPRNPGRIYLSLWSGSKLVDSWLGPFTYKAPVFAEYEWVKFSPISTAANPAGLPGGAR